MSTAQSTLLVATLGEMPHEDHCPNSLPVDCQVFARAAKAVVGQGVGVTKMGGLQEEVDPVATPNSIPLFSHLLIQFLR